MSETSRPEPMVHLAALCRRADTLAEEMAAALGVPLPDIDPIELKGLPVLKAD